MAQARQLFDQVVPLRAQQRRLQAEHDALAPVDRYMQMALQAGNLTYDSGQRRAQRRRRRAQRLADTAVQLHQAESDLHVLLGLAASAPLDLVGGAVPRRNPRRANRSKR